MQCDAADTAAAGEGMHQPNQRRRPVRRCHRTPMSRAAPDQLSEDALRASRTYGAAADHYRLGSLAFWDRFGAATVARLPLRARGRRDRCGRRRGCRHRLWRQRLAVRHRAASSASTTSPISSACTAAATRCRAMPRRPLLTRLRRLRAMRRHLRAIRRRRRRPAIADRPGLSGHPSLAVAFGKRLDHALNHGRAGSRRAVRHLPCRSVPSHRRVCCREAVRACRLRRRGAGGADLLRPARL